MIRKSKFANIGPGALITAAFIGPGTVTACTLAGANFGYALLWALLFATVATIILQEMSARLGLITQQGLGENLRNLFAASVWKWPLYGLILVALYCGNAAYEGGNLSGAALGIGALSDAPGGFKTTVLILASITAAMIWLGSYKAIERILITLVGLMAAAFIFTFFAVSPDMGAFFKGMAIPSIPDGSLMTVIALIGTTIVPYNLFLHASAVKDKWKEETELSTVRTDTAVSIGLGGLITILLIGTAAASLFGQGIKINGVTDMARQVEPVFGAWSKYMLGAGFFAAGLTSSLTAPLATAYAVTEILGIKGGMKSRTFKLVALSVIAIGATFALTGIRPVTIIFFAQFANGLLLPIIAVFLLYAMNNKALLGQYANSALANILGGSVVLITAGLGLRSILRALGVF